MDGATKDQESGQGSCYSFSSFQFFPASGEIHFRGRIVRCPVQSARILHILVKNAGEVVTRDQLRSELWPENSAFASDDAITKAISYLRDVLRDSSRSPKYIETLPKRGYRFIAPFTSNAHEGPEQSFPRTAAIPSIPSELKLLSDTELSGREPTEEISSGAAGTPFRQWRWGLSFLGMAILLSCFGVIWMRHRKTPPPNSPPEKKIRVGIAPFEAEGAGAGGLAESFRLDLTDALAQSPHLRVNAAHGSHSGDADRTAMLALQADVLILGKLSEHAGRVQLQLELARGNDATHLATFKYDVAEKQLILLRKQTQRDLLEALKFTQVGEGPALGSTDSAEAYAVFLEAREHLQQWNAASWEQAASEFRKAIQLDPRFARAYSGLAATLIAMAEHSSVNEAGNYQEASRMAEKALDLDPQAAEAYADLGNIAYHHDWDFPRAERAYRRAIELDPAHSHYHVWLADLLCVQGHFAESIREVNMAHMLDPAWKSPYLAAIFIYSTAGQPDRSLAVGNELLALDPKASLTHLQIGWTDWYNGQYRQAVEEWRTAAQLDHDEHRVQQENLGMKALESGGPTAYARLRLQVIESGEQWKTASNDLVPSEWFVFAGQNDSAIAALNTQIERHDRAALEIAVDPAYAPLRHDARYQMLVRRMGFSLPTPLEDHAWHSVWE